MPTQIQWRRGNTAQTAVFTGAVGEVTVDTTKNTLVVHDGVTAGGYALAKEAAQQDALAYSHANSAYEKANTVTSAYTHANAAYNAANTKFNSTGGTISGDVSVAGNVIPTTDNDKYLGSESYRWHSLYVGPGSVNIGGISLSNVNNILTISGAGSIAVPGAPDTSKISLHANAAFDTANTALLSTGAYGQANAAYTHANAAYSKANTGTILAQAAFDKANSGYSIATSASSDAFYATSIAQSANNVAQAAFDKANTATDTWVRNAANSASSYANSAYLHANAAYVHANTKFSSSGGTITGSVTIDGGDLTVSGNLTIGGNTTSISANNLVIDDSIIYLANNASANTHDIGVIGHFIEGSYQHTGLVRDASDGKWKFFSNVATEPSTTVDFTGAYWDTVKVGIIEADTANIGNFNLVTYIGGAYAHANAAYVSANNVAPQVEPAYNHANAAYVQANTATLNAAAASSYANSAYAKANTSLQTNASGSTTGTIYAAGLVSNTSVTVNTSASFTATGVVTTSTSQVTADSFLTTDYRTVKYLAQITSGSDVHSTELMLVHDDSTVYITQYNEILTANSLGTFDATITTGTLSLLFTPVNNETTLDLVRTGVIARTLTLDGLEGDFMSLSGTEDLETGSGTVDLNA